MTDKQQFDFWYAVNNTQVVKLPSSRLDTFGNTIVNYHLVTELMDEANRIRIREGRIEAFRPQIITPNHFEDTFLEGFHEQQAREYIQWLRENQSDLQLLTYGFSIRKQEVNDHIITDNLTTVVERVKKEMNDKDDPMGSLLIGVDEPWEVCLVKLMVEVVQQSLPTHIRDLSRDPHGHRREIEAAFIQAAQDRSRIPQLGQLLKDRNLWSEYEDRFFALVKSRS